MFWDTSAPIPLVLPEPRSVALTEALATDREVTLWWGTPVECLSATYRGHRETPLPASLLTAALERLRALVEDADTVAPTDDVRRRAGRLVAAHPLRAADAQQLAAALVWCEEQSAGEVFVCLDDRLREAARREGFSLLPASARPTSDGRTTRGGSRSLLLRHAAGISRRNADVRARPASSTDWWFA